MGLLDFLKGPDINQGIEQYKSTEGAVLLDVRSPEEFAQGRVPGSKNIPVSEIRRVEAEILDKNATIFSYCYSGARSKQAVAALKHMGYNNVVNIGGISSYKGKIER